LKTKLIWTILFLALTAIMVAPIKVSGQATPPTLVIDIQRTMTDGPYGVIHVTDQFTIMNPGPGTASYLDVGVPQQFRGNLYYVSAEDSLRNTLTINAGISDAPGFYWLRIQFAKDLASGHTYTIYVNSVYNNLIQVVQTGLQLNFTAAPILTQDARSANVTFVAPAGSTFVVIPNTTYVSTRVGGFPAYQNRYAPWKAYSQELFYAPFRSVNQQLLNVNYAERDIIIGNDGSLMVQDSYSIYNPGIVLESLSISLPDGAYNVMAYDLVGNLWSAPQSPGPPYQVTVTSRDASIKGDEYFNFTLTYNLPQSEYMKPLAWWGRYNLTLSLLNDNEDFMIANATVKIITPNGVQINNMNIPPQSPVVPPIQLSSDQRTLQLAGITSQNNLAFSAIVNYIPFLSGLGTISWLFGLEIAIFGLILLERRRRGPTLAVPIPVERLREFVGLYDERLALSREILSMEEEVNRGGLVKHEYRRRRKVIDLRLDEVNKLLMGVKSEIRGISPRLDELIRKIDRSEAEAAASRASLDQVRVQYRTGKLTKETYETVSRDISKRIDKAEENVETVLITLREEAR
jgi:hypothetical protein